MSRIEKFGDIAELEDVDIQRLLRKTEEQDYLIGLRGAEDAVKDALYRNMSERVRNSIQERLETESDVQSHQILEAQDRILKTAQTLPY